MKPAAPDRISFYQSTPGFGFNAGAAEVKGTSLSGGIKNWNDWRKLRTKFQSLQDPSQHAFPEFFDYATRNALRQEALLSKGISEAAKNGAFNLWVPVKTPVFGQAAAAEKETVSWWNMTRLGRPGNELAWEETQRVILTPTLGKKAVFSKAVDPTQLPNAIELTAEQIASGSWQQEVIKHFFTETERTGWKKFFLPKYTPNANYWQEVGNNWRFAASAGKSVTANTQFWQGFKNNMIFFSVWAGVDMLTYPGMKSWMTTVGTKDQQEEMKKYGDTFDPKKLEEDNKIAEEQNESLRQAGIKVNTDEMTTFNEVSPAAQNETSEGAALVFPVLAVRRHILPKGLGGMTFVSEQDEALYQQYATRIQMNRAMREQRKNQEQAMQEEYRKMLLESIQNDKQTYLDFFASSGPAAQKEIAAIFDDYLKQVQAVLDSDKSLEKQDAEILKIQEKVGEQLAAKTEELTRMDELLQDQMNWESDPYSDPYMEYEPASWEEYAPQGNAAPAAAPARSQQVDNYDPFFDAPAAQPAKAQKQKPAQAKKAAPAQTKKVENYDPFFDAPAAQPAKAKKQKPAQTKKTAPAKSKKVENYDPFFDA